MNRENDNTTTKIPKSKAKTAYGLLSEVIAVVLAEPKRLRMSIPLSRGAESFYQISPGEMPACGTVGCVAGWAVVLRDATIEGNVTRTARGLLGLDERQADELFFEWDEEHSDGTEAQARSEARLIRKFQKKYRAQLLAKKVAR